MSDGTASAREPSMEDILASIRRIIDEEDTRDARPSPEIAADSQEESRSGPVPVMAAAPVNRGAATHDDDGLFDDDDDDDDEDEDAARMKAQPDEPAEDASIFPERESPFWSRATGRDAPDSDPQDILDESADDSRADISDSVDAGQAGHAETPDSQDEDGQGDTRPDIFARAQHKLDSGPATRLSARERMQSLAARAGDRAKATGEDDPARDSHDDDVSGEATALYTDTPDTAGDARADTANILDLTDPFERTNETREELIARAGDAMEERGGHAEERLKDAGKGAEYPDLPDLPDLPDPAEREVLDLTTPIDHHLMPVDTGSVESGDAFRVSGVDAASDAADSGSANSELPYSEAPDNRADDSLADDVYTLTNGYDTAGQDADSDGRHEDGEDHGDDIEDAISQNLGVSSYRETQSDAPDDAEPTADPDESEDDLRGNTYSRFDSALEHDDAPHLTAPIAPSSAAFTMLEDEPAADDSEPERADEGDEDVASMQQEHAPDEDAEQRLGFPDTFSASDVYHDDPPALDDDYSLSLDPGADADAVSAPSSLMDRDEREDDIETVGGMVRDAMERDPVDYADPAALVSMTSEEISARSLASLADVEGEATRRVYGALRISEEGGSETLEGMVRGMLRPMLREWLDDNLPSVVESTVRGEVERISAKAHKISQQKQNKD